jgi:hypothetical protein
MGIGLMTNLCLGEANAHEHYVISAPLARPLVGRDALRQDGNSLIVFYAPLRDLDSVCRMLRQPLLIQAVEGAVELETSYT